MGEIERETERKCVGDRESGRSAGYCAGGVAVLLPRSSSTGGSSCLLWSIQQQGTLPPVCAAVAGDAASTVLQHKGIVVSSLCSSVDKQTIASILTSSLAS